MADTVDYFVPPEEEYYQVLDSGVFLTGMPAEKMRIIVAERPDQRKQDSTGYSWDDAGMADLFALVYSDTTRYCAERRSWYTYYDGAWRQDVDSLLVGEKIKDFYTLMTVYCSALPTATKEQAEHKAAYTKFISTLGDRRRRQRLMGDAQGTCQIKAEKFDSNPFLINCKNGTFDLKADRFYEAKAEDFLTMQTNFTYTIDRDRPQCPRWQKFIEEVTQNDKDKADYLQRALGYSILGKSNEECMFILHGKTARNGKSTLLDAIEYLLGDYATTTPVSVICGADKVRDAEAASPVLAALKGKRFVHIEESNQYGSMNEDTIKAITGGTNITARHLYEKAITYKPQFSIWLSCNSLPAVNDKSLFASERVRVIEFNRHFTDAERDRTLKDFFREDQNMRGIFTWLLIGYKNYKKNGLKMADHLQKVITDYENDNDVVLQFLQQVCKKEAGEVTRAKTLYDKYKSWSRSNGAPAMSAKKFNAGVDLHPEWYEKTYVSSGFRVYRGIVIRSD